MKHQNILSQTVAVLILLISCASSMSAQETISGVVSLADREPAIGAHVMVAGIDSTVTDTEGRFALEIPSGSSTTIEVRYMGYADQSVIFNGSDSDISIVLSESSHILNDVTITASRKPEHWQESSHTVEVISPTEIAYVSAPTFYDHIGNLKGVVMHTSSITFPAIITRGFGKPNNNRFVQLIDGMDNMAPLLNFSVGNIVGISDLDVHSVELVPGAASALYGPNAFNGMLLMRSKNPFDYEGISARVQGGVTDAGNMPSAEPMYTLSVRFAKQIIADRLAIKVNASYMRAQDWRANDYQTGRVSTVSPEGSNVGDPNFDGMNLYGDDIPIFVPKEFTGLPVDLNLRRTGLREEDLLDNFDAGSLKLGGALHYRIKPDLELSYNFRYGLGSAVYQGGERYALRDFSFQMQKIELAGTRLNLKAYMTRTDDGDSYNLTALGGLVNEAFSPTESTWVPAYAFAFGSALAKGETIDEAHVLARQATDSGIPQPGSPEFEAVVDAMRKGHLQSEDIGAGFIDDSRLYHAEGTYILPEIDVLRGLEIMVGGNFRRYDLFSNGTVFNEDPDGRGTNERITNNEFGVFGQFTQRLADERLRITASLRYDKNENFDGQLSPRMAAVYLAGDRRQHAVRASFQTGFRNPSNQEQFIYFDLPTGILLGGTELNAGRYGLYNGGAYSNASWQQFLQSRDPADLEIADIGFVKPERVQVFELGYKSIVNNSLTLDINGYHSRYRDFVAQQTVVLKNTSSQKGQPLLGVDDWLQQPGQELPTVFRAYTNSQSTITSTGIGIGFDYRLPIELHVYGHYNWQTYSAEDEEPDFDPGFNMPEHIFMVGLKQNEVWRGAAFDISYRWQDSFEWEGSWGYGTVESFGSLDANVSYAIDNINTIVKVGSTNILGQDYQNILGGPTIGRTIYASVTYGLN